jgi:tetratricopeptide (TPR) repeat protein
VSEPTPKQSLAVPPRGRLEETSPFRLYYLVAAAESSGLLWLGEGMESVAIWMKQGTPQAVHCEALRLDTFLLELGTINQQQLEAAAPAIARSGGDIVTGLFTAGVLNPSETFPLIQQHALAVLWRGLSLEKGPFTYDPAIAGPPSAFPLGNRWQILSNAARRLDRQVVMRRLQGHESEAPLLSGSTNELALTAQETRIIAYLDGARSLETLANQLGVEADPMRRLALLMQEIDKLLWVIPSGASTAPVPRIPTAAAPAAVVAPAAVAPPVAQAAPVAAAPAAQAPSTAKTPAASPPKAAAPAASIPVSPPAAKKEAVAAPPQATIPELVQLIVDLKQQDFFARLKLARNKGPLPNLKANYLQLAKTYHPDMVAPDAPAEMRELRAEVLAFLNEAYQELSDETKRDHYLGELEAAEEVGDVNIGAIMEAEDQFQRGTHFFKARKYQEAFELFDGCIKLNDREGEFYAWRGYARFLAAANKRAAHIEAREDLRRALGLSPRCVVAYLFDGHMAKLLDAAVEAQRAYQKVLQLEPGNVEAQREVRLYEQRKR